MIYIARKLRTHHSLKKKKTKQILISLLKTVFYSRELTWDECQQFLATLFMVEEWDSVGIGKVPLAWWEIT